MRENFLALSMFIILVGCSDDGGSQSLADLPKETTGDDVVAALDQSNGEALIEILDVALGVDGAEISDYFEETYSDGTLGDTPMQCEDSCLSGEACTFITALAQTHYGLVASSEESLKCPSMVERELPCSTDEDCPVGGLFYGGACVLGNCVFCWEDTQCGEGEVCRGGRCVNKNVSCFPPPPCTSFGCKLVAPSEMPCPVCVCKSPFNIQCSKDEYCYVFSFHPFRACVYGRCVECRNDKDCSGMFSGRCLPPGLCYETDPLVELIFGTWLIGWSGGLNHFSYFRFEPDGTLRRGRYKPENAFEDDIPLLQCPNGPLNYPLLGTWEPLITESSSLIVHVSLNIPCDNGDGWQARLMVVPTGDHRAKFKDLDKEISYTGMKVPPDSCSPDFSQCKNPDFSMPIW